MTIHFSNHGNAAKIGRPASGHTKHGAWTGGIYRNGLKRLIESVIVLISMPIVLPFLIALTAIVMLNGSRPFYSQMRIGRNGRLFRMWKLRTMVPEADLRLQEYLAGNPRARAEWEATQKLKNDPRITPIGRFLRKSSIDELPQLWNVLNGSMSLVGPRPMMPDQQSLYFGEGYYNLRPGITGMWQVSDRNEGDFAGRAVHDDAYERCISAKVDAAIMGKTVGVVLRCTGY